MSICGKEGIDLVESKYKAALMARERRTRKEADIARLHISLPSVDRCHPDGRGEGVWGAGSGICLQNEYGNSVSEELPLSLSSKCHDKKSWDPAGLHVGTRAGNRNNP